MAETSTGTYLNSGKVKFSDINVDVLQGSQYELVYDVESIEKSILCILGTRKKSRVMRRTFGSYVEDLLFDPIDSITAGRIQTDIMTAIKDWEPRIILQETLVVADPAGARYYVRMNYFIPALNKSAAMTFNLTRSGNS